jgi:hypothetical protein
MFTKRTVLALLVTGSALALISGAAVAGVPQDLGALKQIVDQQALQIAALNGDVSTLTSQVTGLTDQVSNLVNQVDSLVNEVGGYKILGQWYDGHGNFSRYFESGEPLLTIGDLPPGAYLLTAHVFAKPLNPTGDTPILCSVGREGIPVGSGESRWVTADGTSTVAIAVVGTYSPWDNNGTADLRCYGFGTLAVAQASLTAIPLRNFQLLPPPQP